MALLQTLLSCVVGLVFYSIWSSYFARNPLDDIPGPPRQHWWTGKRTNIDELICTDNRSIRQLESGVCMVCMGFP